VKKLAIAQIILGILVVSSLIYWVIWVSTGYLIHEGTGDDGTIRRILGLTKQNPLAPSWMVVYFVLGLSVIGCGIAQFVKARHKTTGKGDRLESGGENRVVKV